MQSSDSIKLYNSMASDYREYSNLRQNYLNAIDTIVIRNSKGSNSIIDFGAGDGERIKKIASLYNFKNIYLVENSPHMLKKIKEELFFNNLLDEDFSNINFSLNDKFDMAVSLWNVLGHIEHKNILYSLINIRKSISNNGVVIIDINNRHNIKQYGWKAIRNIIKDILKYDYKNGDIRFTMKTENSIIPAKVHLFTKKEIEKLFIQAGFCIKDKIYVNYSSGKIEPLALFGQLCYILTTKK